ncbi:putative ferredoxin reductase [Gordonia hirsuta DSM 44140 = NBRC 16056]|uniref:Putative ferredoxin reductase n=1 Tax=Gordonia hirsuta DSM 44140 = NBRC 16056 TaxID=1121927 RepID=L7L6E8_9ACTN|nr:FAD-dependent oxidoreductase [Gordonia hirsuta]GAC56484.1 putative ferredoxin reductase [Gordonia hirsuta DSM 44140 = NBRC 16056]
MTTPDSRDAVVIVGGGLGASRLAEKLRGNGFPAPIIIVSAEDHPPYDRPPLSKTVLTDDEADRTELKPAEFYASEGIELRLSSRVTAVEPSHQRIVVEHDGTESTLDYGTLVLATGLVPRPFPGDGPGLAQLLRTYDDALALRRLLPGARTAVVIGAGFIGCEVAASLARRGLQVTVVEPGPAPLAAALGGTIGRFVGRLHTEAGVDIRTCTSVTAIRTTDTDQSRIVELGDGTELAADLVIAGIGGYPALDYLDGSGIALADPLTGGGIACDDAGRTSAPDVYAIGDAANWAGPDGERRRVEHWNHTVDQAVIVAAEITGQPAPPPTVPYFWSDQYDLKVQLLGSPLPTDQVHVVDDDGRRFLAYYSRDGVLTGVVGAGRIGKLMKTRPHLLTKTPVVQLLS